MVKKLTVLFFFLTFLIISSVSAIDNYIIFDKILSNGDDFGYIEPMLDGQKDLSGFIYTDTAHNRIVIERFNADTMITLSLTGNPLKTAHFFSDNFDTLFCFTVYNDGAINSVLTKFTIADLVEKEELTIDCYTFTSPSTYTSHDVTFQDINIEWDPIANSHRLHFQKSTRFQGNYDNMGPIKESVPTSAIINPATFEIITKNRSQSLYAYPLSSPSENDYICYSNIYYFYDFRVNPSDPDVGSSNTTDVAIYNNLYSPVFEFSNEPAFTYGIFLGDFKPSTAGNELIYFGSGLDLGGYYSDPVKHLGCYSFSTGFADELWYNDEIGNIKFEYVFRDKDYLVGRRGNNEIIFLDYLNGNIEDSTNLYRDLFNPIFYDKNSALNLFGRNGDTLVVYQFDVTAYVIGNPEQKEEIPLTFNLLQNHPNPFNGETRLEFEVLETDNFSLKIYNVLGQEIKHLAGGVFAPGTYQYYWDGKNENHQEQSSGIYFARLQSDQSSQMIKLIFIK